MEGPDGTPLDTRLDRRLFLGRMAALTAAVSAGGATAVTPIPAAGAEDAIAPGPVPGPVQGSRPPATGAALRPSGAPPLDPFHHPVPLPDAAGLQQSDHTRLTLAEAASLIREGRLDPVELLEAYLARIEAFDAELMAFNTITADRAMDRARALARAPWRGPLHGIPLAIKDNYYTAGVLTTANSRIFADFVPDFDATAWARLQDAGAVLIGKTQMGPLATTAASTPEGDRTTYNAWAPGDRDVSPGGSSSGSATAVAAGFAAGSTGTQTGGSITNPSLAQGLTGIKPTMGRVSLYGVIPLTYTRDHPGPLCRDARDAAIMLQAMAGPDPADPRTLGVPPVPDLVRAATPIERNGSPALRWPTTIGVPPGYLDDPDLPEEQQDPQSAGDVDDRDALQARLRRMEGYRTARSEAEARREMLDRFRELGARIEEIEYPDDWDTLTGWTFNNVRLPERTEPFLEHLRSDVRAFGVSLSPWINGLLMPGAEYLRGQRAKLLLLRRILDDLFARCDVVLQTSPIPFDIVGLPLIAFPIGMASGRPTGALLGGHPWAEDRLLSMAGAFQGVTDWHRARPADPTPADAGGDASRPFPSGTAPGSTRRDRIDVWDVMIEGQ